MNASTVTSDPLNSSMTGLETKSAQVLLSFQFATKRSPKNSVIQAFAKLQGEQWHFYVRTVSITLGRNTQLSSSNNSDGIMSYVNLGPSKVISRNHATIQFNFETQKWELFCLGRNGLMVNSKYYPASSKGQIELSSGSIIDIGGVTFTFQLPDSFDNAIADNPLPSKLISSIETLESSKIGSIGIWEKSRFRSDSISKPPLSYAQLIAEAINSSPSKKLNLAGIYAYISEHYAYYRNLNSGWQNSIRHNLSLNKAFRKVPRTIHEPGKGMLWYIDPTQSETFEDGNKKRRGRTAATFEVSPKKKKQKTRSIRAEGNYEKNPDSMGHPLSTERNVEDQLPMLDNNDIHGAKVIMTFGREGQNISHEQPKPQVLTSNLQENSFGGNCSKVVSAPKLLTPLSLMNTMPVQFHDFKLMDAMTSNSKMETHVETYEYSSFEQKELLSSCEGVVSVQPKRAASVMKLSFIPDKMKPISPPPTACESPEEHRSRENSVETIDHSRIDFDTTRISNSIPMYS